MMFFPERLVKGIFLTLILRILIGIGCSHFQHNCRKAIIHFLAALEDIVMTLLKGVMERRE
jgi:Na+/H+-dicarboxylate symporter